jgi:hypothetical protein
MQEKVTKSKPLVIACYILAAAVGIAASGIIIGVIIVNTPIGVKEYDMYLKIGNYTGFNVDNKALFFGTVIPSSSSSRQVTLVNNYDIPTRVEFQISGNISVHISNNKHVIMPHTNTTIEVTAYTTPNSQYGNYTGKFRVLFFPA